MLPPLQLEEGVHLGLPALHGGTHRLLSQKGGSRGLGYSKAYSVCAKEETEPDVEGAEKAWPCRSKRCDREEETVRWGWRGRSGQSLGLG